EFPCAVNPLTTMAFHALMNIPVSEIGSGKVRFAKENVDAANTAIASSFGLKSRLPQSMPAAIGISSFPAASNSFLQDNALSTSYAYVCVQLSVAANVFVTAVGSGDALDFYDALFLDARDGVIDGAEYGVNNTYLASALSITGIETDGSSSLINWLSTQALSAGDEAQINIDGDGFDPAVTTMIDLQSTSTGAARVQRIDSFDVLNYPYGGATVLTIKGHGFRSTDVFEFQSFDDSGASFEVDRDDATVDGEYQFHSDSELRILIPDFSNTTKAVDGNLQVATGTDFRRIRFRMHSRPGIQKGGRDWFLELTDSAKVTDETDPLLVSALVGRVDAANELSSVPAANAIYPSSQDPAALVAGTDDVYELRVRVANPNVDGINNMTLDLAASTFEQSGNTIVPDVFGGSAANRAIIFESTLPSVTMNAGDVAELVYRFTFLDTAIGPELLAGIPLEISPVLSGVSQGTGAPMVSTVDITGLELTLSIGNADPDQTPELGAIAALTLPASITAGQTFDVEVDLTAAARVGAVKRDLQIVAVTLTLVLDSETVVIRYLGAFEEAVGPAGSTLTGFLSQNSQAFPIGIKAAQTSEKLIFSFNTDSTRTGTYQVTVQVDAVDTSTGAESVQISGMASMTVLP
ncbi:MAG: hypothetical protein L3J82_08555, partial [Planctomycetes bacterium]|nr:hypothetical protein [Planctomycetota bacterium]